MAKTLLDAVNAMFQMAELISGDANALTSLTDSARQGDIDYCVISFNQVIDELYSSIKQPRPKQRVESTITLAAGTRNYTLATNFTRLHFPLIDKTNAQYIFEYGPGYDAILRMDPEEDDTGIPNWGVIKPTNSDLYVYPTPAAEDDGKIYTYQYDKDLELIEATDTMPFNNAVFRALAPAAFQVWKRERRGEFDPQLFKLHLGRAARLLPRVGPRTNYNHR